MATSAAAWALSGASLVLLSLNTRPTLMQFGFDASRLSLTSECTIAQQALQGLQEACGLNWAP